MACSKLFSGDIPELINKIIKYLRYDSKTLHSCILVNRLWCRLAIPLLWEDPFLHYKVVPDFIGILLHNLNEDDKTKLNEYIIIHNDLFPSNTLFNYPSFIQNLNTSRIFYSIGKWIKSVTKYFIRNLSDSQISNFKKLIWRSLFLVLIKNEINLHSLEIILNDANEIEFFDEFLELILQNPNFIYNIKNFNFRTYVDTTEDIIKFLELLHFNCKSISSLHFRFLSYYNRNNYSIIEKVLSRIIGSQENLRIISFANSSFPLYHLLLSLRYLNCSNTLNTIMFYVVSFENITVLSEVFNQLNVLESIHIVYCYHLDSKFIQQIKNIYKPFKLKSLILSRNLGIESIKFLIQLSGNYLENIGIIGDDRLEQILPLIIKYCSKIKYLNPIELQVQNLYLLFDLIKNITQNLNYLTIGLSSYNGYDNEHFSSIILLNLGQILPFKLEYLNLRLVFNTNDLKIFLKNSQNTFIKKLLIYNYIKYDENENILPYIEEYIMKKKRVKYLAVLENSGNYSFDKVEVFQLYDIQIIYYYDLIIDPHRYIEETYLK
ncbi:hypothetical protein RclHR1_15370002 [Rhizophagus clarus]|uniref:F-box domain-containing protein n=1 Tax=Rhizophagus clarus TaxID=94130 RepID=A0A2Z6QSE0_9GLOM|nr:hypothetical protein RclHR1_15370002 [Rhizophagus clarus]GES83829.1 hypothetical protein GLOIN_2v1882637 [Rhizophagus clarus]